MSAKLATIERPAALDIPAALRLIASDIENGDYDDAHNLAWVIDCGNGRIEAGILGRVPEPATLAYFLFGLAKRKLEDAAYIA